MTTTGRVVRVAVTVAGAVALGAIFVGTAQARPNNGDGGGGGGAIAPDYVSSDDSGYVSTDDTDYALNEDGDNSDGVHGVDKDPGKNAKDNLDGKTQTPGVHEPTLGTVDAPAIQTH